MQHVHDCAAAENLHVQRSRMHSVSAILALCLVELCAIYLAALATHFYTSSNPAIRLRLPECWTH